MADPGACLSKVSAFKPVPSNSLRALPDGRLSFSCPHCSATLALAKEKAMEGPCPHCGGLIALQPPKEKLIPPPPRSKILPAPLSRPPTPSPFAGQSPETRTVAPKAVVSAPQGKPIRSKSRRQYRFGFLFIAPLIIAAIAYVAMAGAKPFREWVDARLAERAQADNEKAAAKTKPADPPVPTATTEAIPDVPVESPPPTATPDLPADPPPTDVIPNAPAESPPADAESPQEPKTDEETF